VQRYLNTVDVVASLYDPAVTRLRTGKSAGSPNLEELLGTSHLRARCEPLYHQVLVFFIASAWCFKTSYTLLPMYSNVILEVM
jgi:hypothetical protein